MTIYDMKKHEMKIKCFCWGPQVCRRNCLDVQVCLMFVQLHYRKGTMKSKLDSFSDLSYTLSIDRVTGANTWD